MGRTATPAKQRTPLTRERIADAALAIMDAEGLDAVSMRRVAREVGVEAMSLYNHVHDKDDLLGCVLEQVMNDPRRRDVIVLPRARSVEVVDRHRLQPFDQYFPNQGQTPQVDRHGLTSDFGEPTIRLSIRSWEQRRKLGTVQLDSKDVVEQPVRLDECDVVQRSTDAVVAAWWAKIERAVRRIVKFVERVAASVLHCGQPASNFGRVRHWR